MLSIFLILKKNKILFFNGLPLEKNTKMIFVVFAFFFRGNLKFPKSKIFFYNKILLYFFFFFFFSCLFPKFKKKYLPYLLSIVIFSVSLSMVNIYKFCKEILIQPPGKPREQHLGDVRTKKFELNKISYKNKMTGMVDIF